MFSKIFGKKITTPVAPPVPEFRIAKDMVSYAKHVVTADETTLCGSETAMYGKYAVTSGSVTIMAEGQHRHPSSYLCGRCAELLTGHRSEMFDLKK